MASNYVLFSPVGATDPVRELHDGPMLHIVRHYQPKKVYLFFTKGMAQKQEITLEALKPFNIKVHSIITDIDRPHDFDVFLDIFTREINRIQEDNPESSILVNITSGTPQMNSVLCLEVVSSQWNLRAIQVKTPAKGSNEDLPHGGDIEDNLDNLMEDGKYITENRCLEPDLLSFRRDLIRRDIASLVEHHEYNAAYKIIEKNNHLFSQDVIDLIKYAMLKQNDNPEYRKVKYHAQYNYTKDIKGKMAANYYCILKNKAKTGELSYFVLLLKPLAEYIAKHYLGEIDDQKAGEILKTYYLEKTGFSYRPTYYGQGGKKQISYNLEQYICLLEQEGKPKDEIENFRKLKDNLGNRNVMAHDLHRETEINTNEILNILKHLLIRTFGNRIKKESLELYEIINQDIIKIL
ncbi:MAG: hypothetical protein GX318_09310 [Clostridia bacterium]|nr:hypothetical protein [Clostridia bacterium]